MDFYMVNDFTLTRIPSGYLYRLENKGGYVEVVSPCVDPGMVFSLMHMHTNSFSNQERIGDPNCFALNIATHGRDTYYTDNGTMCTPYGTGFVSHPGRKAYKIISPTETSECLTIGIELSQFILAGRHGDSTPGVLKALEDRYGARDNVVFSMSNMAMVYAVVLKDVLEGEGIPDARTVHRLVTALLMELYHADAAEPFVNSADPGPEDSLHDILVKDLGTVPNIASACEELGVDKCNICKKFSRVYGKTPYSFHRSLRLLEAAKRLTSDDGDIASVARSVGFTKEGKFAEVFKREFGVSPRYFRRKFWESLDFD